MVFKWRFHCPQRYIAVISISLYFVAFFVLTACPESLQGFLIKDLGITTSQYSTMASMASWSSLLDLVHGYLIERWLGLKKATIIYLSISVTGCIIFISSGFLRSYVLMFTGRVIFGLGGNPLTLCMGGYSLHWFGVSNDFNLVLALTSSVVYLANAVIFFVTVPLYGYLKSLVPRINENMVLGFTIGIIGAVCLAIMLISIITLIVMYKVTEDTSNLVIDEDGETCKTEEDKTTQSILKFTFKFWILALETFAFMTVIASFCTMSQLFLEATYGVSLETASHLSSYFNLFPFLLSTPVGILVDRIGRNHLVLTAAIITALISHLVFYFALINPIVPVTLLSLSSTLSLAGYALFTYASHENQHIVAYGICQTGTNGAIALGSLVSGYIVEAYGFKRLELFFLLLTACLLPCDLLLWILDCRSDNILNLSALQRRELNEEKKKKAGYIEPDSNDLKE